MIIKANYIDIENRNIYAAAITIDGSKIVTVQAIDEELEDYILPGFIDAHIHIESSMLLPSEFAKIAVTHGTIATISDPHEIANVCGVEGIEYMIRNGNKVPLKFHFGAPSCVPATSFETAGAIIDADAIPIDSAFRMIELVEAGRMPLSQAVSLTKDCLETKIPRQFLR